MIARSTVIIAYSTVGGIPRIQCPSLDILRFVTMAKAVGIGVHIHEAGEYTRKIRMRCREFFTAGAKFRSFFIGVPDTVRKMHDALRVTTMPEAAGVP